MSQNTPDALTEWEEFERHVQNKELHRLWGPRTVQIEIMGGCNFKCIMCDRWKWKAKHIEEDQLSLEELIGVLNDLSQNTSCREIILSGGEPFMRKDLKEIVAEAKNNNLGVSIFTNGSLLNDGTKDYLVTLGVNICFSLDGSTAETHNKIRGKDSFDTILSHLFYFSEKKRENIVGVNFVIQRNNHQEMLGLYKLLKQSSIDYIRFGIIHGNSSESLLPEQIKAVKKSILELKRLSGSIENKKDLYLPDYVLAGADLTRSLPAERFFREGPLNCYKVNNYSLIDTFGNVFPCTYAYFDNGEYKGLKEKRMKSCLGNVRHLLFSKIWDGQKYNDFRNRVMPVKIDLQREICGQCEHYFEFKQLEDAREVHAQRIAIPAKMGKPEIYLYEFDGE